MAARTSSEDNAIDLALAVAERQFGIGLGSLAPEWVRDRIYRVLVTQAARGKLSLFEAAEHLLTDRKALTEIGEVLRVGETRFYRDPLIWQAIEKILVPSLPANAPIAGLSAGCSSGEEAYTLGMVLASSGRPFSVLGVDRSSEAIGAAVAGIYTRQSARDLPAEYVERYCEVGQGSLRIRDGLRTRVTFAVCDLVNEVPRGGFHIILLKNVLLYLSPQTGEALARRLLAELHTEGLMFTAATELPSLRGTGFLKTRLGPGVTALCCPGH